MANEGGETAIGEKSIEERLIDFSERVGGRSLPKLFVASPIYRENTLLANEAHSLLKSYLKTKYPNLDIFVESDQFRPREDKALELYVLTTRKILELSAKNPGIIPTFAYSYVNLKNGTDSKSLELFERMFSWTIRLADGQRIRRDRAEYYDKLPKRQR